MTDPRQRAYATLLRIARVKEVRADVALVHASGIEQERRHGVEEMVLAREAVASASQACTHDGKHMDLARYEVLTLLDVALADRHEMASRCLDEATRERMERASENVLAKRYRERVGEQLEHVNLALMRIRLARTREEAIELWVGHQEEQPWTDISSIVASRLPWQQDERQASPVDFAHELAKGAGQSHGHTKAPAGKAEAPGSEGAAKPLSGRSGGQDQATTTTSNPALEGSAYPPRADLRILARATVQPVGMTEALLGSRIFGWHAFAQVYLSELTASEVTPNEESDPVKAMLQLAQAVPSSSEVADSEVAGIHQASSTAAASEMGPAAELPLDTADVDGHATEARVTDAVTAAVASSGYWAERSLHFTRHSDGRNVAWVRDYRLGGADADRLVRSVLQEAQAGGLVLEKIMLNGREAWSSHGQV